MVRQTRLRQRLANFDCQDVFSGHVTAVYDSARGDKSTVQQNDGLSEPLNGVGCSVAPRTPTQAPYETPLGFLVEAGAWLIQRGASQRKVQQ